MRLRKVFGMPDGLRKVGSRDIRNLWLRGEARSNHETSSFVLGEASFGLQNIQPLAILFSPDPLDPGTQMNLAIQILFTVLFQVLGYGNAFSVPKLVDSCGSDGEVAEAVASGRIVRSKAWVDAGTGPSSSY